METKTCTKCNEDKLLIEFNFKNKAVGTRQSACKKCSRLEGQNHYRRNKTTVKRKSILRSHAAYKEISEKLRTFKENLSCVCCGESHSCCLEFHHIDPTTKENSISNMVAAKNSWDHIKHEIEKCAIVCSNCHKKIHANIISLP